MSKKPKTASVHTRCNEYKDIFRVDDSILFCNYCNISVDWKRKSTVDNHCKSQKHISNVKSQKKTQNNTQLTLSSTQAAAEAKKQLIEDLIEAFATADIPLEKVNSLLSFFKKYIKNGGSIPQAPTLRQNYLPNVFDKHFQSLKLLFDSKPVAIIMDETTDDCARSVVNTIFCYRNETKLVSVDFLERVNNTTMGQSFLDKIKEVFVNSPARRGRYLAYLKMHGIFSPCKIPLYNKTRWNSWFRMVSYAKDHIVYWPSFFKEEFNNDKKHNTLAAINSCLENEQELGIITIYLNFITSYAKEFVQDLDFFQQLKKPVFPFVELRLQQLTAYIETYRNSDDFGLSLENLINSLRFNTHEFYSIFRAAFEAAYAKFAAHIPNHPARPLFHACQVFDPKFIHSGDVLRKNIRQYNKIKEFDNPSDELIREWGIYCGLDNELLGEMELDQYWVDKATQLPILSNIAMDYIWLPISSCTVERSFSMYNSLLDSDRQNLSQDSLKRLNMIYFNGVKI
ncbi:CGG triplet repeat-binding protein 1 [Rhizophagus irregularis DAOM 181602=DAOM 197198]|nr:CGG triplet repeat-binding protein 1 [Rhizophagus irregularis DAOM 181602=DAOM 197198]